MNFYVLLIGILLVIIQGILSSSAGYLTQGQMARRHGVIASNGYSFMEHGGMWADVFLISPLVAYIMGQYSPPFTSPWALFILAGCIVVSWIAGRSYSSKSIHTPGPHAVGGKTTIAGWVHGVYALGAMWVLALVYLVPSQLSVSHTDLCIVSAALTPFFFIGAAQWNHRWFANWEHDKFAQGQTYLGPIVVWVITLVRIAIS